MQDVTAALTALEAHNAAETEKFKDFPENEADAGKFYALPEKLLPDDFKLPEGVTIQPDTEMLNAALPILHKHKISREAFHDLARAFTGQRVKAFQADQAFFAAENKKLGENAAAIRSDTATRMKAKLGEKASLINVDEFATAAPAGVIEVMQALMADSNVVPLNQNRDTTPSPQPQSLQDRWYPANSQKAS